MAAQAVQDRFVKCILEGDVNQALYDTCQMLLSQNTVALEDAWITALSRLGHTDMTVWLTARRWYTVCCEVGALCASEGIRVKEALLSTTKVCMLARYADARPPPISNIARIRGEVQAIFPDSLRLTQKGTAAFARVLPADPDERAFAERLLVGMSKLWDAVRTESTVYESGVARPPPNQIRTATEYLLRRKQLALHMPTLWPYPTLEEQDRGDMVWFLWGTWMCCYPWTEPLWKLYSYEFKRSARMDRAGLLMGCQWLLKPFDAGAMGAGQGSVWTDDEQQMLDYVAAHTADMWRDVTENAKAASASMSEDPEEAAVREHIWSYVPRGGGGGSGPSEPIHGGGYSGGYGGYGSGSHGGYGRSGAESNAGRNRYQDYWGYEEKDESSGAASGQGTRKISLLRKHRSKGYIEEEENHDTTYPTYSRHRRHSFSEEGS